MLDNTFYIRAQGSDGRELATGIQVTIPYGLTFEQAHRLVVGRVTEELVRHFAGECVTGCSVVRDYIAKAP